MDLFARTTALLLLAAIAGSLLAQSPAEAAPKPDAATPSPAKPAVAPPAAKAERRPDSLGLILASHPFQSATSLQELGTWSLAAREELVEAMLGARVRRDCLAAARLNQRLQDLRRHAWSELRRLAGPVEGL